jgi:cell division control protein 6
MKFLEEEESLFKDEEALDYNYLPSKLPHRDSEMSGLASCMKPLVHKRKPTNMLVYGKHGIGKTASVRFLFKQLEEVDVKTCFINCWENQTSHSILLEIAKLVGIPLPRKGIPSDSLLQMLKVKLPNIKGIVLALDEVDKLERQDVLYQLSELFSKKICLILITNHNEFVLDLEPRIRSRLSLEMMEFKPYSLKQVGDILNERKKVALRLSILDDKGFDTIVEECHKNEDIRIGLFLLLKSGRVAENAASKSIKLKHIKEAMIKVGTEFSLKKDVDLSDEENAIIECIKKNPGKVSGEIYELYKKGGGALSNRSYRKYIKRLMQLNLVEGKKTGAGFRGKSRELYAKC